MRTIFIIFFTITLMSCASKPKLDTSEFISVHGVDLPKYWAGDVYEPFSYPDYLIKKELSACVIVFYVIDSSGKVRDPEVWKTFPEKLKYEVTGWSKMRLNRTKYKPATSNTSRVPVYTYHVFTYSTLDYRSQGVKAELQKGKTEAECYQLLAEGFSEKERISSDNI